MFYDRSQLHLLREIISTQFKLKDQTTWLGTLWSLLNPLLMLTVLFVVFSHRLGQDIENFALYLLVGIVQYTHFSNGTVAGMHVLYNMRQLTRDTIFPKELLVIGTLISRSLEYVVSLCICVCLAQILGADVTWRVLLLPAVVILQLMLVTWVSLFLSFAYLFVRDVDHIYNVLLRALFFLTPIFYDLTLVRSEVGRQLVLLNPLTHLVMFARAAIMGRDAPSSLFLLLSFVVNAALLWAAFRLFKRFEPKFAEAV